MKKDNSNGSNNNGKSYEVGYKKPPSTHKWKKGQSGNPKGQKKAPPKDYRISMTWLRQTLMNEAYRLVNATEGGENIKAPKIQLVFTQLFNMAAKGNIQAAKYVTKLLEVMVTKNDQEVHEWIGSWTLMQDRLLKAKMNPGSREHISAMHDYFMFKRNIRKIEGEETWPYEPDEPVTTGDWHMFLHYYEEIKKNPHQILPWPPKYISDRF